MNFIARGMRTMALTVEKCGNLSRVRANQI
jgi:hypothetical protein